MVLLKCSFTVAEKAFGLREQAHEAVTSPFVAHGLHFVLLCSTCT